MGRRRWWGAGVLVLALAITLTAWFGGRGPARFEFLRHARLVETARSNPAKGMTGASVDVYNLAGNWSDIVQAVDEELTAKGWVQVTTVRRLNFRIYVPAGAVPAGGGFPADSESIQIMEGPYSSPLIHPVVTSSAGGGANVRIMSPPRNLTLSDKLSAFFFPPRNPRSKFNHTKAVLAMDCRACHRAVATTARSSGSTTIP